MEYSEYNDAFSNNEQSELDRKARELNNKKKNMYKSVNRNNKKFEKEMARGIEACYSDKSFTFLPINNHYKQRGDFVSGLPTPFDEKTYDTKSSFSDDISKSSTIFLPNSESDLSSEYSSLPKKAKKHLRLKTEHLKKYSEDDESSPLDHIRKCDECKQQIINFLKDEGYIFPNNKKQTDTVISAAMPTPNIEKEESILGLSYKEIRDIVILIMVGIVIIITLS